MTDKQLGTSHLAATDPLVASHGYEVAERASILQAEGMSKELSEALAIRYYHTGDGVIREAKTPATLPIESPEGWQ